MRQLFVTLVLVGAAGAAWGESSLTTELEAVATRYHENPARLDTVRETLEQAAGAKPEVDTLVVLAHVCFIWGDVRAATAEQKLEAYDQGRQAARRALERGPRNAAAHFWFATNTARWGQTKGILRSLFLLPTVQEEIQTVLELDPGFTAVLGKTLIKKGRITDARRELQAVLEETAPTNPADWALKDAQEARALLESIRSKSS
jgi:tetratricopeptide (TPR) repeat protein